MDKLKVFIAQSSEETLNNCAEYFGSKDGFEIIKTTTSGTIADEYLRDNKVDVIILDIILKDLDGLTLIENIRKQGNINKNTKIVVLSSLSHKGFANKVFEIGGDMYFAQPINFSEVESVIKNLGNIKQSSNVYTNKRIINRALEEKLSNIFITVGIPAHIKGYQFLREAIKLAIDTPDIINSITKKLYPTIAEHYDTSSSKVERAIRHAIEVAWNRGKIENINEVFGLKVYSSNEKPTNGEFIALVADKVLIEGA